MRNRIELFEQTCNTFLGAWFASKLKHGDAEFNAIGHICQGRKDWTVLFCTTQYGKNQRVEPERWENPVRVKQALDLVLPTGYTVKELAKIEYAFESAIAHNYENLKNTGPGLYLSLRAATKALFPIHCIDGETLARRSLTELQVAAFACGVNIEDQSLYAAATAKGVNVDAQ